ncbi:MAG: DNA polymerase III subunit epsilon, partial [Alphaproteobacteria bacterium]|nr:DNA polymerase III subunit epsilon [Alphaproteobacteria bacterium]
LRLAFVELDALCKRFNIELDERKAKGHGALLDVELLAQVYLELSGGRQAALELVAADGAVGSDGKVAYLPITPRPKPLPPLLTQGELDLHQAAVAGLGAGAIWRN